MKTGSEWINHYLKDDNSTLIEVIELAQKESYNEAIEGKIQSKEVKKLIDFLVTESKVNFDNVKELGWPEFRIVIHEDGSAYAHVMNRDSSTVDFKLPCL